MESNMGKDSWWNTFGMPKEEPTRIRDEKEGLFALITGLVILVIIGPLLMKYQENVAWLDFENYYFGMFCGMILAITCLLGFPEWRKNMGFKLYVNEEEEE